MIKPSGIFLTVFVCLDGPWTVLALRGTGRDVGTAVFPGRTAVKSFKGLGKVALAVEAAGRGDVGNGAGWFLYQFVGALHDPVF